MIFELGAMFIDMSWLEMLIISVSSLMMVRIVGRARSVRRNVEH